MINDTKTFESSFIEINEHNELIINNKMKKIIKTNKTNSKKYDTEPLKNNNAIELFFLLNKINGSTINIIFG